MLLSISYPERSTKSEEADLLLFLPDKGMQGSLPDVLGKLSRNPQSCFSTVDQLRRSLFQAVSPVLVVVVSRVTEGLLRELLGVYEARPMPVVLFTEHSNPGLSDQIISAGVSAYVVNGLSQNRLGSILETACARFHKQQALSAELEDLRTRLRERKIIDRAKGLLMSRKHLSEQEAYKSLRKLAMDKGQSMAVVSQSIIEVLSIFDGK